MIRIVPRLLQGRFVRLEPFTPAHKEELRAAVDGDPDAFLLFPAPWAGPDFDGFWARNEAEIAEGARVAFAIRRLTDGAVIGTSSFLHIRAADDGLEVGSTFLVPEARSGPANPEIKRLMLGEAFAAGAMRVELVTDARNLRSAAAIAKLGAVLEGTLRQYRLTWTGHRRDTLMFSILDREWPAVRAGLDERLAAY